LRRKPQAKNTADQSTKAKSEIVLVLANRGSERHRAEKNHRGEKNISPDWLDVSQYLDGLLLGQNNNKKQEGETNRPDPNGFCRRPIVLKE
jgi:hypothetical protein